MELVELDTEPDLPNQIALVEAVTAGRMPESLTTIPTPAQVQAWTEETDYSEKYSDEVYEYRRVTAPRGMLQVFPQGRCMAESEWRSHGITMSRGWQHYDHHSPEANVLMFRRVLGTDPKTGQVPPDMAKKVRERKAYILEVEHMRQQAILERARRQDHPAMDQF